MNDEEQLIQLNIGVMAQHAVGIQLDLNEAPMVEDPQEMIIHPAIQQDQVEVLQLMPQHVLIQQQDQEPQASMQVDFPVLNAPGENFLHHEIPEDDLMDEEEINMQAVLQQQEIGNQQNDMIPQHVELILEAMQDLPDAQEQPVENPVPDMQVQVGMDVELGVEQFHQDNIQEPPAVNIQEPPAELQGQVIEHLHQASSEGLVFQNNIHVKMVKTHFTFVAQPCLSKKGRQS